MRLEHVYDMYEDFTEIIIDQMTVCLIVLIYTRLAFTSHLCLI
jgi:hypothetical protein